MSDDLPTPSCAEFAVLCQDLIEDIQADREAYEEAVALRFVDDGLTTTERARKALEEPDTPWGKHAVARAWLATYPESRIWTKLDV